MSSNIYFLNTGHSDCIILESGGRLAMVDAAEDTEYPPDKPNLKLPGYEDLVVDFLIKNFADANGVVNIDFVLGTHAHSDHIGGFDTVINHPMIKVKKAFLKPYEEKDIFIMERLRWDNTEVYNQMLDAIRANDVELIDSFDNYVYQLGEFKITFFNGCYRRHFIKFGENINSVVTLVEIHNKRILLAGDMNYKAGDERRLANRIGKVDVLKVGHHGYVGSTSRYWAKTLNPDYCVVCNRLKAMYPDVRYNLTKIARSEIYATADVDGVLLTFDNSGSMEIKTNCMNT